MLLLKAFCFGISTAVFIFHGKSIIGEDLCIKILQFSILYPTYVQSRKKEVLNTKDNTKYESKISKWQLFKELFLEYYIFSVELNYSMDLFE